MSAHPVATFSNPHNAGGQDQVRLSKCELFLSGSWRLLTTDSEAACEMRDLAEHHTAPAINTAKHHDNVTARHNVALEKARRLQYSRAMNLLRSAGIATDDLQTVHAQLSALHPPEDI